MDQIDKDNLVKMITAKVALESKNYNDFATGCILETAKYYEEKYKYRH